MSLMSRTGHGWTILMASSVAALVVVTALLFTARGTGDMKIWERWTGNALRLGVVAGFRENNNDYPPLSDAVLWVTGHAGNAAGLPVATAIKLSLVIFLAATLILFFGWVNRASLTLGLWSVFVLNAVGMGYLDIYAVPPLILSLWALQQSRPTAAVTWFTVACLVKWQPLLIGPFLLLHVGRACWPPSSENVRRFLAMLVPSVLLLVVAIAVFDPYPFFRAFAKSLGHRALSGDTLNLPWIATWIQQAVTHGMAGLTGQVVGIPSAPLWLRLPFKLLFAWQFLVLLHRYVNGPVATERTLAYSLVGFLAYVTLSSGVHENHWFVPSFLAIALLQYGRQWLKVAVAVGVIANLNLLLFYGISGHGLDFTRVVGIDVTVPLAAVAVAMYFWLATVVRRMDQAGWEIAAAR
ncbi:MAG: hypothetical protein NT151_01415 [Acidobacteria bacterium]|nr:hypothetical protein [Acidobacteriota bacterium]